MTKDELEKSIVSGDQQKQDHMRYLIDALPMHTAESETLEKLARAAATTKAPQVKPEVPDEFKKLLGDYGLLDSEGKPVEIAKLPVLPDADHPSSLLATTSNEQHPPSLEDIKEEVSKVSLVKAKDYETFKPIESSSKNVSSEMESFLKQFGLMDSDDSRKRKSIKTSKASRNSSVPLIDSSYLIPGYSSLLDNIGIPTIKDKNSKKSSPKASTRVARPTSKGKGSDDDFKKLGQLLETIRELEKLNASLTEKEVDRLNLNNYNFSESLLSEGPDPLKYHIHYSALKNEVKRQSDEPTKLSLGLTGDLLESSLEATDDSKDEISTTKSVATTKSKPTTTSTTTTEEPSFSEADSTTETVSTTEEASPSSTEEAKKNSLEDEIEPIDDPEPLPPPRRSGFYMLFDWNSFLEVGEDPDKIVVRFDPKIGDPSRFLNVNVP